MIVVTDLFKEIAQKPTRQIELRILSNDDESTTYSGDDILDCRINRSVGSSGLQIGNAISDRLLFTLKSTDKIKSGTRLTPYIRYNGDEPTEWLRLGRFYCTQSKMSDGVMTVTAYDKLYNFDRRCTFQGSENRGIPPLEFPATHQQMWEHICNFRGVSSDFVCADFTCAELPLANPNAAKNDNSRYFTQRQIIGMIAACNAGNAVIDNNGKLTVRSFSKCNYKLNVNRCFTQDIDIAEQFTVKGILFHIDSSNDIFIDDDTAEYSDDRDGIVVCDNPLATADIAEFVWHKLGNLAYSNCDVTRRGVGWLDTGEVLQMEDFYDSEGGSVNIITSEIDYYFSAENGFTETIRSVAETAEQSSNRANSSGFSGTECVGIFGNDERNSNIFNDFENNTATGIFAHAEGTKTVASGDYSHAEGWSCKATESGTHAEGLETKATGYGAHSEGFHSEASGMQSHAEGGSTASDTYSHAEGCSTASGYTSHAEGGSTASGSYSHAEGCSTASGYTSHAEGGYNKASGYYSHAEGFETKASGDFSHAEGHGTTASGNFSHAEGDTTEANGLRSHAEGERTTASGSYSHAEGHASVASGGDSHSEGAGTTALGDYSHAEGHATEAAGTGSHAEGYNSKASGNYSHAEGCSTASGYTSHAEGSSTASGDYSHAEGERTTASGDYSHAEGQRTEASEYYAHAEGNGAKASGNTSHAEGVCTVASGDTSHAEGNGAKASGNTSHAEGVGAVASGDISHAEGIGAKANGDYSHAEGCYSEANGDYSHTSGFFTIAAQNRQFVAGYYNTVSDAEATDTDIFVVGNGESDTVRSNAFRVSSTGDVYAGNSINASGADFAEMHEWSDSNVDGADRAGLFVTYDDGDKIRLANASDSYILGVVSAVPTITGNTSSEGWHNKYLRDVFGRILSAEKIIPAVCSENGNEIIAEHTEILPVINPDYDPNEEYISRDQRPEWAAVGLIGKLVVKDNGSCNVNGYCKVGDGGIATNATENGYRVLKRIDEQHILIMLK